MIEKIREIAQASKQLIGLGVDSANEEYLRRTIHAAESAAAQNFGKILLVGDQNKIESTGFSSQLQIHHSLNPERTLVELLNNNLINGIVRGSLGSSKFLKEVKQLYSVTEIHRIALLETASRFCFFFAPIGIDEGTRLTEKVALVKAGLTLLNLIKIGTPLIGILSGGRLGDLGRDAHVDKTISEAQDLISLLKDQKITENAYHYEILIEDAIAAGCRIILAPDGISGNLIYRTLVHLGNGKSHGAWYSNIPHPIIDTSRVGPTFEYESAVAFASALASRQPEVI